MRGKSKRGRSPEEGQTETKRFKGSAECASPDEDEKQTPTPTEANAGSRRSARKLGKGTRADTKAKSKSNANANRQTQGKAGTNKGHRASYDNVASMPEAGLDMDDVEGECKR